MSELLEIGGSPRQASEFRLEQISRVGGALVANGERFVWVSAKTAPNRARGGARACPLKPWPMGVQQRTKRTDYPGATVPSVQVQGAVQKPQTLNGRFDDRYNYPGYAVAEQARVEKVITEGLFVRWSLQGQTFEGLLVEANWDFRRHWDIGYSLTFDVHRRSDAAPPQPRNPQIASSPLSAYDDANQAVDDLTEAHAGAPLQAMQGTSGPSVGDVLRRASTKLRSLGQTLDARELSAVAQPVDVFKRLGTQFRGLAIDAFDVLGALYHASSDIDVAIRTPEAVWNFEDWSRSMRYHAHVLIGGVLTAAREVEEHSAAKAVALYRPRAGESLYSISQRYYGTPHAWRTIAERNDLSTFRLTGDELLIIPERGSAP